MAKRLSDRLGAGSPVLFLASCFLMTLLLQRSYAINSDEGYTLNAAWQVWNGMKMYDDFRQLAGPGSGYAIYALWKIVGSPSFLAARLLSLVFSFSSTTAVYLVLRRLGVGGIVLALTMFVWLIANPAFALLSHNAFSSFAATWFLLLFLRIAPEPADGGGRGPALGDHALVGAAAGIVFLFLQTKGSFLALGAAGFAFSVGIPKRDYRGGLALTAGFIVVIAPLFVIWSPALLVRQWLTIPLAGHYLRHNVASGAVAITSVAFTAGMAWMAMRRGDRRLKALAVTQAALIASMSHNLEFRHLAINAFPALIFVAAIISERLKRDGIAQMLSPVTTMTIIVVVAVVALASTAAGREFLSLSPLSVDILRRQPRPILFSSRAVVEARAIYAGPYLPGLYFELKKRNPFFVSETIVCDDDCQQRLVAEVAATKPELAFLYYDIVRHLDYDENSPVDAYLRDRYVQCHGASYGGMVVRAREVSWCP